MDMAHGHGAWTWRMDMVHGHGAWTWRKDTGVHNMMVMSRGSDGIPELLPAASSLVPPPPDLDIGPPPHELDHATAFRILPLAHQYDFKLALRWSA